MTHISVWTLQIPRSDPAAKPESLQPRKQTEWSWLTLLPIRSSVTITIFKSLFEFDFSCTTNTAFNSKWGCHKGGKTTLNVVITDWKNNLIYPRRDYIEDWGALWYSMPGGDDLHSRELVFTNFGVPFYLERYRDLRIWCGEDLKDSSDSDNQGRVCVYVFVKYYWDFKFSFVLSC